MTNATMKAENQQKRSAPKTKTQQNPATSAVTITEKRQLRIVACRVGLTHTFAKGEAT